MSMATSGVTTSLTTLAMRMLRSSWLGAAFSDRSDAAMDKEEEEREEWFQTFMSEEGPEEEADLVDLGFLRAIGCHASPGEQQQGESATTSGDAPAGGMLFVLAKHVKVSEFMHIN